MGEIAVADALTVATAVLELVADAGIDIVRTIVANHHGQISLTSAEEEGTTAVVRLPLLLIEHPARTIKSSGSRKTKLTWTS